MQAQSVSLFQPLRHQRFRQLWFANAAANLGTWTQTCAAAWTLASLSDSALAVALMPSAMYAPLFLFSLAAGLAADSFHRGRLLLIMSGVRMAAAAAMAFAVMTGHADATIVLLLTFALGCGNAFSLPAWQAATSTLVTHEEIGAAARLNNLSYNLSALLGPWLAGMLIEPLGAAPLFLANALSLSAMLWTCWRWSRASDESRATPAAPTQPAADTHRRSSFSWAAFQLGIHSAWQARSYRRLLIQSSAIFFASVAYTALLPLFVRDTLRMEGSAYGMLMGAMGAGAVLSALLTGRLRAWLPAAWLLAGALALFGAVLILLPLLRLWPLPLLAALAAGLAWSLIVTTLNGQAQSAFPEALRARTLSVYILAVAGAQAAGAAFWGMLHEYVSLAITLPCAGAMLLACAIVSFHLNIKEL
ncbi:MFS transporter [Massilia sp. BJB1822]|uniref:MFS transporter n=1 Tax=Massilia sp. BJB1822 TaxID=2744470 RepID=UPI0015935EBA|nr:MFS transporter [Massilia sp. BJB1822]NVD99943.1 MFS transporter [Massilia sp. BJB1822]